MACAAECVKLRLESRFFEGIEVNISLNSYVYGYILYLVRVHGLNPLRSYRLMLGRDVLPVNAAFRDTQVQLIFRGQQSGVVRGTVAPTIVLEEGSPCVRVTLESSNFGTCTALLDVSECFGSIRARVAHQCNRELQDTFLFLNGNCAQLDDSLSGRHVNLIADANPIIKVIFFTSDRVKLRGRVSTKGKTARRCREFPQGKTARQR